MKIEKFVLISAFRGLVQLFILAGILAYVFSLENVAVLFLILGVMAWFSAQTASKRLERIPDILEIELFTQFVTVYFIMGLVITLGILPLQAEFLIPIGGMVAGNTMDIGYLVLDRMLTELKNRQGEIESALALGGNPRLVLTELNVISNSMRNAITPNLNRLKALGIVAIPGLMAGMIIGGINPLIAAFYQILIFFLIIFAGLMAGYISSYLAVGKIFHPVDQRIDISFDE